MNNGWEIELKDCWGQWYDLRYNGGKLTGRWKEDEHFLYIEVEKQRVIEKYLGLVKSTEPVRYWYREDKIKCVRIFNCEENSNGTSGT